VIIISLYSILFGSKTSDYSKISTVCQIYLYSFTENHDVNFYNILMSSFSRFSCKCLMFLRSECKRVWERLRFMCVSSGHICVWPLVWLTCWALVALSPASYKKQTHIKCPAALNWFGSFETEKSHIWLSILSSCISFLGETSEIKLILALNLLWVSWGLKEQHLSNNIFLCV